MKKIISICLIALLMMSFAVPAMAAEGENLALGASVTLVGINDPGADVNAKLVNGVYTTNEETWNCDDNWNVKHSAFAKRYNADGEMTDLGDYKTPPYAEGYPYYSLIILDLNKAADLDTFRMIATDADMGVGAFRLQEFDILVSATGEAGSWKVAHEARDTRNNDSWVYVDEGEDLVYPYWVYEAKLTDAANCKFVAVGVTMLCNHDNLTAGQFINLLELEVYGAGADAPVTEDTTPVTEDTTPVTEDTTPVTEDTTPVTEDTTPVTEDTTKTEETEAPETFDFVIVPVVALAAAAAGAVVLKKKEN